MRSILDTNGDIAFIYCEIEYFFAYFPTDETGSTLERGLRIGKFGTEMVAWYGTDPVTIDTPIIDGKSFRQLIENGEIIITDLYGIYDKYYWDQ